MIAKFLIAGNWKMNTEIDTAVDLAKSIMNGYEHHPDVAVLICPPFTQLMAVRNNTMDSHILIGAQNCHHQDNGAYTGEISASMLNKIKCNVVILGHSERREYFNESNEIINHKIYSAQMNNIYPIYCIGETLEERKSGLTNEILKKQLIEGLKNINHQVIIAYEPIWAIGTGVTPSTDQISETHKHIRSVLSDLYPHTGKNIQLLYGGSLNENNAKEILPIENVNGGLIGGASLSSEKFLKIIEIANSLI